MIRVPLASLNGFAIWRGNEWIGTVWHSNIWGWQWARLYHPGWQGGQCASLDEGMRNIANTA